MKAKAPLYDVKESAILHGCLRLLYAWGLQPIRNNTGGFSKPYTNKLGITKTHHVRVGKKGSGDIIVCSKSGKYIEIEVKRASGTQEDDQKLRQAYIEASNGIYLLIRSVDELDAYKGAFV